jgi:hypothetical protein
LIAHSVKFKKIKKPAMLVQISVWGEGEGGKCGLQIFRYFPPENNDFNTLELSVKSCLVGPGFHPSFDASSPVVRKVMIFY